MNTGVFRSWTPPETASDQRVWTALARGELMTTAESGKKKLGLRRGKSYRVSGATQADITSGGTAAFGIPGVDAVVNSRNSRSLGLLPRIGVLLSAPGANLVKLEARVRALLGPRSSSKTCARPSWTCARPSRPSMCRGRSIPS